MKYSMDDIINYKGMTAKVIITKDNIVTLQLDDGKVVNVNEEEIGEHRDDKD